MFLKICKNENFLTLNPEGVLVNHIIISTKHLKSGKKIFTHNLPNGICGICFYVESWVEQINHSIIPYFPKGKFPYTTALMLY